MADQSTSMKIALFLFYLLVLQEEVPYKPSDQFAINLDFQFKTRYVSPSVVELDPNTTTTGGVLPYLFLNINVLKLSDDEVKVKIENNRGQLVFSRKAAEGMVAKLDLGFTDDIKDRVTAHEYQVYFVSKERVVRSRILIAFDKDGTYLVNGEKRGKL